MLNSEVSSCDIRLDHNPFKEKFKIKLKKPPVKIYSEKRFQLKDNKNRNSSIEDTNQKWAVVEDILIHTC